MIFFSSWFVLLRAFNEYNENILKSTSSKCTNSKKVSKAKKERTRTRIIGKVIRKSVLSLIQSLWNCSMAVISVPLFKEFDYSSKVLVTFFLAGIFNLIFGFFLNLISVDMVAIQPVDRIDSLYDLMEGEKFTSLTVTTMGGLWQESALKSATVGSLEQRLSERIKNHNYIPFNLDQRSLGTVVPHLEPFSKSKEVIVIDRVLIKLIKSMLCQFNDRTESESYHTSKDWFGERLLVPIISKSSSEKLINWSRYKTRQLFQSHIFRRFIQDMHRTISVSEMSEFQKVQCVAGVLEPDSRLPDPFQIEFFAPFILLCLKIFSFSFPSLLDFLISIVQLIVHEMQKHLHYQE